VLTDEDLQLYEDLKARTLTPDAVDWLEQGGLKIGYPGVG